MPNGYHDVSSYEHSDAIGRVEAAARKRAPKCPECKEPLTARPEDRRFIEDDHYVECRNGHLWTLAAGAD